MADIQVLGRLTRDPEQRQAGQGTVTEVSIASDTSRKDQQGDTITAFYRASFWGNQGNAIMNYFHKGSPIYVAGELEPREYQDKNGNNRTSLDINHAHFSFVPAPPRNQGQNNAPQTQNNARGGNFNQQSNNYPQNNQNGSQGQNNGFNGNQFNQGGQQVNPQDLPFDTSDMPQGDNQQFNQGQQPNWMGQQQGNNQ